MSLMAYEDVSDATYERLDFIPPPCEPRHRRIIFGSPGPDLSQSMKEAPDVFVIVRLAVLRREPTSMTGVEDSAISPAVDMSKMDDYSITNTESYPAREIARQALRFMLQIATKVTNRSKVFAIQRLRCQALDEYSRSHGAYLGIRDTLI